MPVIDPKHNRSGSVVASDLRQLIERIERLEEDKAGIARDIRDVFSEAKGRGFDTRTMRQVLKIRKVEVADQREQQSLLDLYMHALGMLPLFEGE
jgi:uncharacterized protein (UPF0335 family)